MSQPGKTKRGFRPFAWIGRLFMGLSTLIGFIFLVSIIIGATMSSALVKEEKLPGQMILTLKIEDGLIEQEASGDLLTSLQSFGQIHLTTQEIIDTIDRARVDNRVKALAFDLEAGSFGVTHVQELRAAIKRFRAAGKQTWVYSPSYEEAGGSMGTYYLAAAFDQIWMQPIGMLSLPGFNAEMPFMADALKSIGVEPQFFQRKEYKSIMENVSRSDMSPENREMMTSLLSDITNVMAADIAADRKISVADVNKIIDQGVFTDREALAAKLIDRVDYVDALFGALRQALGSKPGDDKTIELVALSDYHGAGITNPVKDVVKPKIALISASGEIVADTHGGFSNDVVTPESITGAFDEAVKDKDIKVIVFRVSSPGGSPTASETIRRAVQNAVAKNKPVIVSMGAMAGSGGYWIITDATRIFALPATLTGSIGVAGGRVAIAEMMAKLNIKMDGVQIGKNADMNSIVKPFSESGRERMNAIMDSIYSGFTDRVAKGRKMTPESVEKIAKGRVWTGNQAAKIGLVDEIGGLNEAYDYTAKMIGLNDRTQIEIVPMPKPRTGIEQILHLMNVDVMMARITGVFMNAIGQSVKQAATPQVTVYDRMLDQKL